MTDNKDLQTLIAKIRALGAIVNVETEYDSDTIESVQFENVRGVGVFPCGPIAAAEAMRDALAKAGTKEYVKGNMVEYKFLKD